MREKNRRGEGSRLREELIEAAGGMIEDAYGAVSAPVDELLSLRGVARAVGAAPQSVYLHFGDKTELIREVIARRFHELDQAMDTAAGATPASALRARCLAYCAWGLAHPGHYRLLFESRATARIGVGYADSPGATTFDGLLKAVSPLVQGDPHAAATSLWISLHGIVSLRVSKPGFPWPPVEDLVDRALASLQQTPHHP
ncbi:TetR/AcrR family transcriptional regulator [Nonomuraea sediminis]|uniref:TetR/AcrR family transcriptional regulator n=1 Tax=Nonomuraea sediminis TaxID=2835864 RepID=UPI001BDD5B99|nr:TetR/AcrR family transcriptional regulator [Nonomuraea sediminis]